MNIAVVYASAGGHTRTVAQFLHRIAQEAGNRVVSLDVSSEAPNLDDTTDFVVLCGAVYHREFHPGLLSFIQRFREPLEDRRSALVAVSLAAALDDDDGLAIDDVDGLIDQTDFEPDHLALVAGAWVPSQWDDATRTSIGTAAWRRGLSMEEDRVLTDWDALKHATTSWWTGPPES